jgi:hypothetical protein
MILRERTLFLNFPGWQVGYSGLLKENDVDYKEEYLFT